MREDQTDLLDHLDLEVCQVHPDPEVPQERLASQVFLDHQDLVASLAQLGLPERMDPQDRLEKSDSKDSQAHQESEEYLVP